MSRLKDESLSIRTSADIKQLLRLAAARERRSVASMVEILVQPAPPSFGPRLPFSVGGGEFPLKIGDEKRWSAWL
ncbi:MAG: hypothetical protein KF778_17110 [Rhodocyclaceae bacterium]|nr:hypothetical protein [Rhodocyclaceae bacterium]